MRLIILIFSLVFNTIFALLPKSHESSASAVVSFMGEQGLAALTQNQPIQSPHSNNVKIRNRRMYAMCPPNFRRVGTECYSLPEQRSSWLEAHFFCKDKNARLAEPQKFSDRKLRAFLPQHDARLGLSDPIWIGASYDRNSMIWQWSISGKNLTYDAFDQFDPDQNTLHNHCAVYDPALQYRWSARSCPDKYRFICQHKMPKVSEKNRYKVYSRWNATYPNQLANEVILEVIDRREKNGTRINRRVQPLDSNEEIIIPKGYSNQPNRQQRNRRPHLHVQEIPNENEINFNYQPTAHPNDNIYKKQLQNRTSTEKETLLVHNEILPSTGNPTNHAPNQKRQQRLRTQYDRKLQRQREKEKRRLQNKRQRQERLKQEKRRKKLREEQKIALLEKQKQLRQQQNEEHTRELDELRKKDTNTEQQAQIEVQNRKQMDLLQEQHEIDQRKRELEVLKTQHADEENKRIADEAKERLRQERRLMNYQREVEEHREREEIQRKAQAEREIEEIKREQERLAEEQRFKEEHEKRLKATQNERERQLQLEHEKKRLQDTENRLRQENEEKQRQRQIKQQQEEEEKLLEIHRFEEAKRFEREELERLKEENRHHDKMQRQRKEEIMRREAEQQKIEQEEEKLKKEIEEADKIRLQQHEEQIRREEEIAKAHEEARKLQEEEKIRKRKERYELLRKEEQSRLHEEKKRKYAERLAALPKEDREKFLEIRKRRKELKEKQRTEKLSKHE